MTNVNQMQALCFDRAGKAEDVLTLRAVPLPMPGKGEVRIRVQACVIHPADRMFIAGSYRVKPSFPQVAGFDGAGVVEALGPGVEGISLGQRVAFRQVGAWADFAVASVDRIYPVPDDIGIDAACQFPLNPVTAWGLLDTLSLTAGAQLLLVAGNSSVARWAAALAIERGIKVTRISRDVGGWRGGNASESDQEELAGSLGEMLSKVRPTGGFDGIADPIGGPGTLELIDACAQGASFASYGTLDNRPFDFATSRLVYKNLRWHGFGIEHYRKELNSESLVLARETIWNLFRSVPKLGAVAARYPKQNFAEALRDSIALAAGGKSLFVEATQ